MLKNKSQHFNFTHEAIPVLFHNNSDNFFKYLEKDGVKFLEFYWKHLTTNLGVEILSSNKGLDYKIVDLEKNIRSVIITLPPPTTVGEAFFLVLVKYPKKVSLLKVGFTRVFSLENEGVTKDGQVLSGIYELTPRARNVRIKDGANTELQPFFQAVLAILKIKNGVNYEI